MARQLRLEFAGACYHVINRGNYRRELFVTAGAAEAFERVLLEACERFSWKLHAYVVMSNHFHLALETPEPNLSLGMKWLQGTWVMRFNRLRKQVGKPFQGRYKALLIEPGHTLAQVCHYIHLNPVRARIVTPQQLSSYRHSSFVTFQSKRRHRSLVAEEFLSEAGGLADTKQGWRKYREYLEWLAEDEPAQKARNFSKMSRGWCIGGKDFRTAVLKDLKQRGAELDHMKFDSRADEAAWELRESAWLDLLERAAAALKVDLRKLGAQKSDPAKVRLAAAMKACSSVSNGWLAERLDMGKPASVSQYVRRFVLAGHTRKTGWQTLLSTVKV
jgi:putative transposase